MLRTIIILVVLSLASCDKVRFDNYKVIRVIPFTQNEINLLNQIRENDDKNISFWIEPSLINRTVDLMISPMKMLEFDDLMKGHKMEYATIIENVQQLIDNENQKVTKEGFGFTRYHTLEEIYDYLNSIASNEADRVQIIVGGKTYENREIIGVKLFAGQNKPIIFIEGGIHAREWISPATTLFLIDQLLYNNSAAVKALGEAYEFHIFPSCNPDGYVYTHTTDRFWRKTKKPYGLCKGADPNRNFDYKWMVAGASDRPCDEAFAGSKPFSEIEMRTLSEYILSTKDNLFAYISFHSYSQRLMFPYGHTTDHLENYMELKTIGTKTALALSKRYGTMYTVGNIAETIYPASGTSIDWVKKKLEIPVVYVYELRDTGRYGFVLPADQIIPNGNEVLDSLVTLFAEARKFGYPKS